MVGASQRAHAGLHAFLLVSILPLVFRMYILHGVELLEFFLNDSVDRRYYIHYTLVSYDTYIFGQF